MKEKVRAGILILNDLILIYISLCLAFLLKFDGQTHRIVTANSVLPYIFLAACIAKLGTGCFFRLHSSLWRYAGINEMVSVLGVAFLTNTLFAAGSFILDAGLPPSFFIINLFTDIALVGGSRFAYRILRRALEKGLFIKRKNPKRMLIIGGGSAGAIIVKELKANYKLNSIPVAIIDDDKLKVGRKLNGVPILGGRQDISAVVPKARIDEIIIAIPSAERKDIEAIYQECLKTSCKVRILPSVSQLIDGTVSLKLARDVEIEELLGREPVKVDLGEMTSYFSGKVVLVTGGGGSIGSELCRQIANFSPKQLIILDNYENNAYEIQNEIRYTHPALNLTTVIANIREKARLENIFRKHRPDIVFHAAAHKHVPLMEDNPTEAIKNNVFGTMNMVECADKYQAEKFVLISTDKAVNPTNIMGATKRIAEMLVQATDRNSRTKFAAVRFGNVLGSNGSVIPLFKKQIEQGGPVTVTHPEITRFFMTIPEAVQLVIQAGAMADGGEIFVLDMGRPVKIYDLARNLIKLSGFEPDRDIRIEFTGLRPGEKLYEELLLAEEGLRATRNDKIFIAPPVFSDLFTLRKEINKLNEIILNNSDEVMEYIPKLVPAYKRAAL